MPDLIDGSRNLTQEDLDGIWDDPQPFPRSPFDDGRREPRYRLRIGVAIGLVVGLFVWGGDWFRSTMEWLG